MSLNQMETLQMKSRSDNSSDTVLGSRVVGLGFDSSPLSLLINVELSSAKLNFKCLGWKNIRLIPFYTNNHDGGDLQK